MNNAPLISIITVCYNSIATIEKTIVNTLKQTYSNIEYIVVDGASTDGTIEILDKYKSKIKYISEPDKGIYDAMNKGLKMATGEWVLFRNSGDYFNTPDILNSVFANYEDNGEALIIGNLRSFGSRLYYDLKPPILTMHYFNEMPVYHPSTIIRRRIHLIYLFPEWLKLSADYWAILSILINGGTYKYVDEIISLYDNSCGASKDNWIKGYEENILILRSLGADEFYIQQIKNKIIEVKARKVKESKLYYKLAKKIFTKNMVNNDHILDNI